MLVKKMLRTAWLYKAQFISMILMVMLGVGVFVGFNMEWASIERNMFSFFDDCNFADYRLVNERGYSAEDAEKIADIEGVDSVGRFLTVNKNDIIWHNGGTTAYNSYMGFYKDKSKGVVILSNLSPNEKISATVIGAKLLLG